MSADESLDLRIYEIIDQNWKDLVNGWIRLNKSHKHIPKCVNQICCIFYFVQWDEWNKSLMSKVFTLDKNNDKMLCHSGKSGLNTAFMTNIVSEGKHCWTFKVIKYVGCNLMFGIYYANLQRSNALTTYIGSMENTAYAFDFGYGELNIHKRRGEWIKYGIDINYLETEQAEIEMRLDLNNLTLSYTINNFDYGVAFKVKRAKYCAAFTSFYSENSVELLKYQQFYK